MGDCKDYWCEHYGSGKCDHCQHKGNERESPELPIIIKRRADRLMEIGEKTSEKKGQTR
jgi:hypothetical protein